MRGKRYREEPKIEAIKQVAGKGYDTDVPQRPGVTYKSLHWWVQKYSKTDSAKQRLTLAIVSSLLLNQTKSERQILPIFELTRAGFMLLRSSVHSLGELLVGR